ncbi:hypothetical protein [Streptomyces sp. NPDC059080]|uniref:hypothetical protein n=1 Tax=Streptomyces sp. NPDC059080 TaxID=3346718 RepID=UPI003676D636
MSSERRPKYPELTLRIIRQGKPEGPRDVRDSADDLEDRDQADIKAGKAVMVEVHLLRKDDAKAIPQQIDSLVNRVGPPSVLGNYCHPEHICDPEIRGLAVDMWAVHFVTAGALVRFGGREYRVEALEDVDRGHAEIGYYTGYAFCRRTDSPPGGRCNPRRLPVDQLVPADSAATRKTGQPVSKEKKA